MEIVYRDEQVNQIARNLSIPKKTVKDVIVGYVNYLRDRIEEGKTIKFLNVCYLKVAGQEEETHETLAYISHELGDILSVSPNVAYRVLLSYEEFLIRDLRKLYSYSIRGLLRIRLEQDYKGEYRVRARKSTAYTGKDITVSVTNRFKRKVGELK